MPMGMPGKAKRNPAGKGLGKAGAKRLGQMLKRVIKNPLPAEPKKDGTVSLPKTPVRFFKHQIKTQAKKIKKPSCRPREVSKVILSVVSQCKHQRGMGMADVKEILIAEGYNVTNNQQCRGAVSKREASKEAKSRSSKQNKTSADEMPVRTGFKTSTDTEDLKDSFVAHTSSQEAELITRRNKNTLKPKKKLNRPNGRTHNKATKSYKQKGKTPRTKKDCPKRRPNNFFKAVKRANKTHVITKKKVVFARKTTKR